MWRKILSLAQGRHHKYRHMEISSLPSAVINGLTSQIYYTPKVQRMPFTVELARYLRFLQRKETVSVADLRKLTESILTEYGVIHGLENEPKFAEGINYGIERNFYLPLNDLIPYEGEVDWLLSLDKFHFCPVMFFQQQLNEPTGGALAYANMIHRSAFIGKPSSGYSIITTGQEWQLFKVYSDLRTEKTFVYEGRDYFKNLYQDFEMVQVILGLIDLALDTQREAVLVLQRAYDLLDERRLAIQAPNQTQARKNSLVGKMLTNYYTKKKNDISK